MTKGELYDDALRQGLSGWPTIRETIHIDNDIVPLAQIDMGYRTLRRLMEMYERMAEEDARQMTAPQASPPSTAFRVQTTSEPRGPERSLIVKLCELGGGDSPGRCSDVTTG
jgi:hypothetical protein